MRRPSASRCATVVDVVGTEAEGAWAASVAAEAVRPAGALSDPPAEQVLEVDSGEDSGVAAADGSSPTLSTG